MVETGASGVIGQLLGMTGVLGLVELRPRPKRRRHRKTDSPPGGGRRSGW